MAFRLEHSVPLRNTVLALLLAVGVEIALRALGYTMHSDRGALGRFFLVLMLAVLFVDFSSEIFVKRPESTPAKIPVEEEETPI